MSEAQNKPEDEPQSNSEQRQPEEIDVAFLKREFEHIRAELAGARERVSETAHAALDRISAYLDSAGLSERVDALEEDLEGFAGKLKDSGKDAVSKLEHQVTTKPMTSVAIAFGIGMLAARLLRRS